MASEANEILVGGGEEINQFPVPQNFLRQGKASTMNGPILTGIISIREIIVDHLDGVFLENELNPFSRGGFDFFNS